jgi:hypothetical protein
VGGVADKHTVREQVDFLSQKLQSGVIEDTRSPSPEPVYDQFGKRLNTRDQRYRDNLFAKRNEMIEIALRRNPMFRVRLVGFVLPNTLTDFFVCLCGFPATAGLCAVDGEENPQDLHSRGGFP